MDSSRAAAELKSLQLALRKLEKACASAAKVFADAERRRLDELEKTQQTCEKALQSIGNQARLPETEALQSALADAMTKARANRGDVERRRTELAVAARDARWPVEHTGTKDFVGPFAIQHRPGDSTITFGAYRLQTLKTPSGLELIAALTAIRKHLEDEARKRWEDFMTAALAAQARLSASDLVAWPTLVSEVIPDPKVRRRAAKTLLFRLSMLLSGEAPDGRRIEIVPPALGEQRAAVTVPRLDRANDDVRVYRVRIS